MKNNCQVCSNRTISNKGAFEICPVCYWEDEGEIKNPSKPTGGPNNDLSLEQARLNFKKYGAVSEEFKEKVRPPHSDELPQRKE
jgi:Cysteine-rich CPCC